MTLASFILTPSTYTSSHECSI